MPMKLPLRQVRGSSCQPDLLGLGKQTLYFMACEGHDRIRALSKVPDITREHSANSSLLARVEVPHVRRCLILLGGHQVTISAEEINFSADLDMIVIFRTDDLTPHRLSGWNTTVALGH